MPLLTDATIGVAGVASTECIVHLMQIISEKIKPKKVEVRGTLNLVLESPDGSEKIKKILTKLQKGEIKIRYISAPKYRVSIVASDYKTAEGLLKQVQEDAISEIESLGGIGSFKKIK